jgi:RNA polymerase sigma factor (TIGR02999 family)
VQQAFQTLIRRADEADREAADKLFAMLYHELRRLAEHNLRRANSPLTLGTTTLLHEAYLNIAGRENIAFADRPRFLAYASRAMRGLVIDYARRRRAKKRGRQFEITLAGDEAPSDQTTQSAAELGRLGDALDELAEIEPALLIRRDRGAAASLGAHRVSRLAGSAATPPPRAAPGRRRRA